MTRRTIQGPRRPALYTVAARNNPASLQPSQARYDIAAPSTSGNSGGSGTLGSHNGGPAHSANHWLRRRLSRRSQSEASSRRSRPVKASSIQATSRARRRSSTPMRLVAAGNLVLGCPSREDLGERSSGRFPHSRRRLRVIGPGECKLGVCVIGVVLKLLNSGPCLDGPTAAYRRAKRQPREIGLAGGFRAAGSFLGVERPIGVNLGLEPVLERLTGWSGPSGCVCRSCPRLMCGETRSKRTFLGCHCGYTSLRVRSR